MPDQRSVMKEFRSLDAKRAAGGLTPAEETRYAHLRDLIGPEMGAGSLSPGFDVDAAASQLRDSLLPAGLRNRPPPTPAPRSPSVAEEAAEALQAAFAPAPPPFDPTSTADLFEPGAFPPDAAQPPLDPSLAGEAGEAAWNPDASYDPNAPPYDAGAQPYDATQGYDPNAQPAWDPNAAYDPAAGAQSWDPNAQPYDPNAQAYDPNAQPFDPNAQPFDPNAQPFDPNAQPFDPNTQPFDPNAQAYDPNAQPFDANAQPYDPNAQPHGEEGQAYLEGAPLDATAQPWDAAEALEAPAPAAWETGAGYDADVPAEPGSVAYDPNASPEAGGQGYPAPEEAATAEADALAEPGSAADGFLSDTGAAPPDGWIADAAPEAPAEGQGEDAGLESLLPFDPAAEAAIAPGELPDGFGTALGEYDDTAGFQGRHPDAAPADLPAEEPGFQAAQTVEPEAVEAWQPEAALDQDFELASGGSFVAAADAAAPEWAGGAPAPPWDVAATGEPAAEDAAAPLEGEPTFEATAQEPASQDVGTLEDLTPLDAELAEPLPAAGEAELEAPPGDAVAPEELAEHMDVAIEDVPAGEAPALDFSRPDFSTDAPEEQAFVDAAIEPGEVSLEAYAAPSTGVAAPDLEPEASELGVPPEPSPDLAPIPEIEEDLPTIEGEEILEEIVELSQNEAEAAGGEASQVLVEPLPEAAEALPEAIAPPAPELAEAEPPEASAAPAPVIAPPPPAVPSSPAVAAPTPAAAIAPPPPAPAEATEVAPEPPPAGEAEPRFPVSGLHRVVVHTVEGHVKRGVLEDADLGGETLALTAQQGASPEEVPTEKVKAIFFMLAPGEKAPAPDGKRVRVTFRDGRQLAGFSPDYQEEGLGFFMIPADTRTNTGRIWVYRAAVRQVSVT